MLLASINILLESLFISLLNGATFVGNMHIRAEYVDFIHDKCQKAYSAVDSCLVLFGGLDDGSLKKQDILAV